MFLFVILLMVLIDITTGYVVEMFPTMDYNYSHSIVYFKDPADFDDWSLEIPSDFPIMFQGTGYSKVYLCSNSYLTFSGPFLDYQRIEFIASPKILIQSQDLVLLSLKIIKSSSNMTIFYTGYRYGQSATSKLQWAVTFYKGPYQSFSIHILANNLLSEGVSSVCTSLRCFEGFDGNVNQVNKFTNCGISRCFKNSQCVPTSMERCQTCSDSLTCTKCSLGYSGPDQNCSSCADNYTNFGASCVQTPARCSVLVPNNPASCAACREFYAVPNCTVCQDGLFFSTEFNCTPCPFDGCKTCTQQRCLECLNNYFGYKGGCVLRSKIVSEVADAYLWIIYLAVGILLLLFVLAIVGFFVYRKYRQTEDEAQQQQQLFSSSIAALSELSQNGLIDEPDVTCEVVCSICLEDKTTLKTVCGHYYHRKCIVQWYCKEQYCPNCKFPANDFYKGCTGCNQFTIPSMLQATSKEVLCSQCHPPVVKTSN